MSDAYDVVIVGGGVAGLYLGWSVLDRGADVPGGPGGPARVAILESDARTGGRILSVVPPGAPDLRAELGAMRYWSSDRLVAGLAGRLGLEHLPFAGEAADPNDVYFLRGARFTVADLTAGADGIPYDLTPEERGLTLMQLAMRDMAEAMPELLAAQGASRRTMEDTLRIGGRPITECSMHDLFAASSSPDGTELLLDGLGFDYGRDPRVGAANVLQMDVDPRRDTLQTLAGGMQTMTDALAEGFRAAGGEIRTGTRVERLADGPDGTIAVVPDSRAPVSARHVVLALPRRALELLDRGSGPLAGSRIGELLDTVVPVPSGKLIMLFDEPWWEDVGIQAGGSITDLPIRRCVYLGAEHGRHGSRAGLVIASYADSASFERFRLLDAGARHPSGGDGANAPSLGMIAEARRDLALMHGVEVPEPAWSAFKDWTAEPYGAGYHYWAVGSSGREVVPAMRTPAPGRPVYVCGEAFSAQQGWINGALISAERVLRDHLGQPGVPWIGDDVDLGP